MSKTHRKPASLERKQSRYGYLFIFPLILGAAVFFIPNMIMTFVYSINDIHIGEGGYTLSWVGFANYYTCLLYTSPSGDGDYADSTGAYLQTSFVDITVREDGSYLALDTLMGRVFAYDEGGSLLYVCLLYTSRCV